MRHLLTGEHCSFIVTVKSSAASRSVFRTLPTGTIAVGVNGMSGTTGCGLPTRSSMLPFLRSVLEGRGGASAAGDCIEGHLASTFDFFESLLGAGWGRTL